MAFESLKNKMAARAANPPAAESAPAKPTTTPPVKTATKPKPAPVAEEVVAVVEEREVAQPAVGGGLSLFNAGEASNALLAWVDRDENRAAAFAGPEFPTVQTVSGNNGGMLDALEGTPGELVDLLPSGKRPFQAIFIGFRLQVLIWPGGYDPNVKVQPKYSAFIGPDAADDQALLQAASVKYMFTKKDDKGKFDDMGHPRPGLELLVYLPKLDHVAVIRTIAHQEALSNTLKSLAKCLPDGKLQPTPVLITPMSVERKSKAQTWLMHHLEFSLAVDADAKAMYAKFQAFATGAKEDAEFMQTFGGWAKTTMTDEIREALQAAANA